MTTVHAMLDLSTCIVPWILFLKFWMPGRKKGRTAAVLFGTLGFLATFLSSLHAGDALLLHLACGTITSLVLAASSLEDLRSGTFLVMPLFFCILGNALFAAFSMRCLRPRVAPFLPFWKEGLTVLGILFLLWRLGLSAGDAGIYLACYLSFLALFRAHSFPAILLTLFLSNAFGVVTWTARVLRGKKASERFPFTAQISLSYYLTASLLGIFG